MQERAEVSFQTWNFRWESILLILLELVAFCDSSGKFHNDIALVKLLSILCDTMRSGNALFPSYRESVLPQIVNKGKLCSPETSNLEIWWEAPHSMLTSWRRSCADTAFKEQPYFSGLQTICSNFASALWACFNQRDSPEIGYQAVTTLSQLFFHVAYFAILQFAIIAA